VPELKGRHRLNYFMDTLTLPENGCIFKSSGNNRAAGGGKGRSRRWKNPGCAVKLPRFYYLDADTRIQVDAVIQSFLQNSLDGDLWATLCERLPLDRKESHALQVRVEGVGHAAETLWNAALQAGTRTYGQEFNRQSLRNSVQAMPMTHYHYVEGSREHNSVLRTRRDALEDPCTALTKLQQDVEALADFIRRLPPASEGSTG
jgi:hypothetical protein